MPIKLTETDEEFDRIIKEQKEGAHVFGTDIYRKCDMLNCPRMDGATMATSFSPLRICCRTSNVCEISKIAPNGQAFRHLPQ